VVADNYWSALQGRKALKVKWITRGMIHLTTKDYEQKLRDLSKQMVSLFIMMVILIKHFRSAGKARSIL